MTSSGSANAQRQAFLAKRVFGSIEVEGGRAGLFWGLVKCLDQTKLVKAPQSRRLHLKFYFEFGWQCHHLALDQSNLNTQFTPGQCVRTKVLLKANLPGARFPLPWDT